MPRSRKRVVHVVPALRLGGMLRTLQLAAKDLKRVHLYLSVFDANTVEAIDVLEGVRCLGLPAAALQNEVLQIRAIVLALREMRADLVHSHHFFVDVAAAMAAQELELPCVRTVHGITQRVQESPFQPVAVRENWGEAEVAEQRRLQDVGVHSIAVSAELREKLIAHGFDEVKTCVIRPAVEVVAEISRRASATPLRIAFPHRLEPVKAPALMLDVVRELIARNLAFQVLVPATGELWPDIHQAASVHGLSQYIQFLPAGIDIWDRIGTADICLLTSRSEGLPFSLLEAMARALPVVATRVGGVPEVVQDGVTGFLCDPGFQEIACSIELLAVDAPLRERMGAAGRAAAVRDFSVRSYSRALEAVYLRVEAMRG